MQPTYAPVPGCERKPRPFDAYRVRYVVVWTVGFAWEAASRY